mgnify:CR=1 FL=1
MVSLLKLEAPLGTPLRSLVKGFILTKQTEGKSPRTVEYYQENFRCFLWYAQKESRADAIGSLTQWQIHEFLGYVAADTRHWGTKVLYERRLALYSIGM